MDKIAILTDSGSNLNENTSEGIFIVSLYVNFGNESKKDLSEISPKELYERIDLENPFTSAPSIDDFKEKIKMIKKFSYTKILAISISQALSGTYNSMRLALESQDIDYEIIDSRNVTIGEGLLALYGHSLIKKGLSFDKIVEKIEAKKKDVKLFASISDLKYLIRGGRISTAKGLIGSSLKINPILTMDDQGSIKNYKSIVGKKRAVNFLIDKIKNDLEGHENYYLAISYAKEEEIEDIKEKLKDYINQAQKYLEGPITSVLGCHAGPSAFAISYLLFS